jgi:hypothetical protein
MCLRQHLLIGKVSSVQNLRRLTFWANYEGVYNSLTETLLINQYTAFHMLKERITISLRNRRIGPIGMIIEGSKGLLKW